MNNRSKIAPEQWVPEYGDYLYRYALSRLQDETSAQDVVREMFLAEFKGAKKFSGQSSEKTGQPEWRVNPRKAFEQREFWVVFESCLDQLQDRLRSEFTLCELERCGADGICTPLEITSTNLWVMLYRARARLKLCIEKKRVQGE